MYNIVKCFRKLVSVVLMFSLMTSVCFAQDKQNDEDSLKIQKIIADMKNESANFVSEYHTEDILLAKILRDAHIAAIPYGVNLETVNNVEKILY